MVYCHGYMKYLIIVPIQDVECHVVTCHSSDVIASSSTFNVRQSYQSREEEALPILLRFPILGAHFSKISHFSKIWTFTDFLFW